MWCAKLLAPPNGKVLPIQGARLPQQPRGRIPQALGALKVWAQDRAAGQRTGSVGHFPSEPSKPALVRPLNHPVGLLREDSVLTRMLPEG